MKNKRGESSARKDDAANLGQTCVVLGHMIVTPVTYGGTHYVMVNNESLAKSSILINFVGNANVNNESCPFCARNGATVEWKHKNAAFVKTCRKLK